ncbi:uncharacterized protein AB9W97_017794 isoform 1-T2 [Spinachia spinachia]
MSSNPLACVTLRAPPSPTTIDRGPVLDHAQLPGPEPNMMEMSEVEYTHLQHLLHTHTEPHAVALPDPPAARCHSAAIKGEPLTTQAIDLSTSTDEHYQVMPGEKTPGSPGEVPGFVLARVRGEDSPTEIRSSGSASSQARSRSAARVCLEKRFSALSADTPRPQEVQSAVFSSFLTMLQQSAEVQEAVVHMTNPLEDCSSYGGGVFDQVTNICEQVIGSNPYMVEPNKHQGLIIPKGFSFNFHPERVVTKAHYTSGSNSTEQQQLVTIGNDVGTPAVLRKHDAPPGPRPGWASSTAPDYAGGCGSSTSKRARSHMSLIQRRERHNSKERERRKRIRLYCDELNMLVPFCESDTDKVTTLQWTTAFLRYIQQTCGDSFKEEFQNAFADGKGHFLKCSPPSGPETILRGMDEALSISHVVEQ